MVLVCQEEIERGPEMSVGCLWRIFLAMVCLVEECEEVVKLEETGVQGMEENWSWSQGR